MLTDIWIFVNIEVGDVLQAIIPGAIEDKQVVQAWLIWSGVRNIVEVCRPVHRARIALSSVPRDSASAWAVVFGGPAEVRRSGTCRLEQVRVLVTRHVFETVEEYEQAWTVKVGSIRATA